MGITVDRVVSYQNQEHELSVELVSHSWDNSLRNGIIETADESLAGLGETSSGLQFLDDETVVDDECSYLMQVCQKLPADIGLRLVQRSLPSILVLDQGPQEPIADSAHFVYLPLAGYDEEPRTIDDLLTRLLQTVDQPATVDLLCTGDDTLVEKWDWVDRYLTFAPQFIGFDIDPVSQFDGVDSWAFDDYADRLSGKTHEPPTMGHRS